jgi:hypothetical protein
VIQVTIEEQPHWPRRNLMTNAENNAMFIGDYAFGHRWVWRMVLPDGTPYAFARNQTESSGRKQIAPEHLPPKQEKDKA